MFKKVYVTPKGIITNFHGITSISANLPMDTDLNATVSSYTNEADYLRGIPPVKINNFRIPFSAMGNNSNVTRSLEQWLLAYNDPTNMFYLSDIKAAYSSDPIIYAQDKQWAIIKAERDEAINSIDFDLSNSEINTLISDIKNRAQGFKTSIYALTTIPEIEAIVW